MYCWVMVEPPCTSPPRAMVHRPRNMPGRENPGSVKKVEFSAATTASFITCGILSYSRVMRFCTAREPSCSCPSL